VVCTNALVTPGVVVIAGGDGVVVVSAECAAEVAAAARTRADNEEGKRKRFGAGELAWTSTRYAAHSKPQGSGTSTGGRLNNQYRHQLPPGTVSEQVSAKLRRTCKAPGPPG
jgi:hypothetical protein